ncbi:C40 family peptidase [Croceivirga radicis]|uniref:C40 family peptidase n=1 Tax=Croceivirga radicis TaxID=1929488 RepID=UPI000255B2FC|nr:C40 family peptidase [Croceivirga radicis]
MHKKFLLLVLTISLTNCVVKKKTTYAKAKTVTIEADQPLETTPRIRKKKTKELKKADEIINIALQFTGTRYKFGGTTRKGMDCSGLVYVALLENNISFPRASYQMATEGKKINLSQVQKGDLLFFKTGRKGKRINHVGLVVSIADDEIKFIHATTSRGVIVSSLREGYWSNSFVKANRIL